MFVRPIQFYFYCKQAYSTHSWRLVAVKRNSGQAEGTWVFYTVAHFPGRCNNCVLSSPLKQAFRFLRRLPEAKIFCHWSRPVKKGISLLHTTRSLIMFVTSTHYSIMFVQGSWPPYWLCKKVIKKGWTAVLTLPGLKVDLTDPQYSTCGKMVFALLDRDKRGGTEKRRKSLNQGTKLPGQFSEN